MKKSVYKKGVRPFRRNKVTTGAGKIEVKLQADVHTALGTHQLVYHNQHQPVKSTHQVNPPPHGLTVRQPPDPTLTIEQQKRDDTGQQIEITYTIAAAGQLEEDEQETSLAIEDEQEASPATEDSQEQPRKDLSATTFTPQRLLVPLALMLLFVLGGLLVMVRRTLWGS